MKDILNALKTIIPAGMTEIKQIGILPDPDILPPAVQYPFVGLKDGEITRSEGIDGTVSEIKTVIIYIYVRLLQNPEASVMGSGDEKGVLDLMEDLQSLLDHNNLSLSSVIHSFCSEEFPSETALAGEDVLVQRKGRRYQYETT